MKFNMTPLIDIVFLLIIFLIVVCQRIDAENFEVDVPDRCNFSQKRQEHSNRFITVTVSQDIETGKIIFAVGSEKICSDATENISGWIAQRIDRELAGIGDKSSMVCLRIDKDVSFRQAQHALAGISQSDAGQVQVATLKKRV